MIRSKDFVTRHAGTHGELLRESDEQLGIATARAPGSKTVSGSSTPLSGTSLASGVDGLTSPTVSAHVLPVGGGRRGGARGCRRFVFMPNSRARRTISYLTMTAILVATVLAPFELAFISQKRPTRPQFVAVLTLYAIMDATFIFEILCQFRTAYR